MRSGENTADSRHSRAHCTTPQMQGKIYDRIFASSTSQITLRLNDSSPMEMEPGRREREKAYVSARVFVLWEKPWRRKTTEALLKTLIQPVSLSSSLFCRKAPISPSHPSVTQHPHWSNTIQSFLSSISISPPRSPPFSLTDSQRQPHTNSSLKCPPEGPTLYSWKVRSALKEKALQKK